MTLEDIKCNAQRLLKQRITEGPDENYIDITSEDFFEFELEEHHWYFPEIRLALFEHDLTSLSAHLEVILSQNVAIIKKAFWITLRDIIDAKAEWYEPIQGDPAPINNINHSFLALMVEEKIVDFADAIDVASLSSDMKLIELLQSTFPEQFIEALFTANLNYYPSNSLVKITLLLSNSLSVLEDLFAYLPTSKWPSNIRLHILMSGLINHYGPTLDYLTHNPSLVDESINGISNFILKGKSPMDFLCSCDNRHRALGLKLLNMGS
jgi:hypothetical protein